MTYNDKEVNLTIGMEVKNYKTMCELLGEEVKEGNSKKAQIANWQRYFSFKKQGQRFLITEIYDEPFPTAEIQRRREGLYVQYIECLLMDIIANNAHGKKMVISKNQLYRTLGMVNDKYARFYESKETLVDIMDKIEDTAAGEAKQGDTFTMFDVSKFYSYSGFKLNDILTSALRSMSNRKLIKYHPTHIIVYSKIPKDSMMPLECADLELGDNSLLADAEQEQIILTIEREAMLAVGCHNIAEVVRKNLIKEYHDKIDVIVNQRCPEWKKYYPVIYLIHSDDLEEQVPLQAEEVRKLTAQQQRLELNARINQKLEQGITNDFNKTQKRYDDYMEENDDWGGGDPAKRPFRYRDDFVEKQKKLINYTININNKKCEE